MEINYRCQAESTCHQGTSLFCMGTRSLRLKRGLLFTLQRVWKGVAAESGLLGFVFCQRSIKMAVVAVAGIRELCGVTKSVDERIDESVLH